MDLLNEVPITLVIKAPNQKVADQTVECALNWTVKKLKEHLSHVYPSNPDEDQQKIIYSGKLLQDDITLKEVLRQHGCAADVHTVHLVCSNSSTDISAVQDISDSSASPVVMITDGLRNRHVPSSDLRRQQDNDNQQQQPLQHQTTGHSSVAASNGAERLQFPASAFHPAQYNAYMSSYLPSGMVGTATLPSGYSNADQQRWLQQQQQAYAQYISNYMQFYQQSAIAMGQPFNYAMPPLMAPSVPTNVAQAQPANVAAQPPAQLQQPQGVRMNAQGGLVNDDDDDEMERDWLDWFYVGVRLSLLMCILFFYSTPTRFLATFILMLFIYCFQIGWFRVAGQGRRPAPPPVNAPAPAANVAEDPNGNMPGETGASGPEEPRQPKGLSLVWSVFLSFFASLAPEPPQPINVN